MNSTFTTVVRVLALIQSVLLITFHLTNGNRQVLAPTSEPCDVYDATLPSIQLTSLIDVTNDLILRWLNSRATKVILRPDAAAPCITILSDESDAGQLPFSISIIGWDQCGLIPLQLTMSNSTFERDLPPEVGDLIRSRRYSGKPGLDVFTGDAVVSAFPRRPAVPQRRFLDDPSFHWRASESVGTWVATHNDSCRLNVSTARFPWVERVMRATGCRGVEAIEIARRHGNAIPDLNPEECRHAFEITGLNLVRTSDCWGFEVRARVSESACSLWLIYRMTEETWSCVQRLILDDF
jgi:hypothetical protein